MKIYIATPVNARKEATLEEKRQVAYRRVKELEYKICKCVNGGEFCEFHSGFDTDIAPINVPERELPTEAVIMGKCVQRVMECDAIYMDGRWMRSNGCVIEYTTANCFGKHVMDVLKSEDAWQPCKSIDEAVAIVRENPITKDMTYEERLAAQKRRFGL